jgi:mannose-6-phosphate isomerase-like protein (cupin superfamily)
MKIPLSEFTKKAKLAKKSDRYEVYDLGLENLVISMTVLHEAKSTTGHFHNETEEISFFVEGKGEIQLDDKKEDVTDNDIVLIPRGTFHRVLNKGKGNLTFLCFFEKYKSRGK